MLNRKLYVLISVIMLALLNTKDSFALPAFPGAEGQGASTIGGRGGTVYIVTNLNDSGPGSFREAVEMPDRSHFDWEPMDAYRARLEAAGHRIIVFKVSGFIHLTSVLNINIPYLTIAGQTSPGGIAFSGGKIAVWAHDVVATHLRIRMGSDVCDPDNLNNTNECDINGDSLMIGGVDGVPAYNIVFDHCSIAWGNDETVQVGGWNADTYDVTLSWCLIAEGLDDPAPENNHGLGVMAYGEYSLTRPVGVTLHHNYMGNFRYRVPEISGNVIADVRNNVSYGWENALSMSMDHIEDQIHSIANFVHNYTKPGPISNPCGTMSGELFFCDNTDPVGKCHAQDVNAYQAMYVYGNLGCARTSQNNEHWKVMTGWSPINWLTTAWQKTTPFVMSDIPVTTTEMSPAYADTILASVGATKPVRDSLDTRVISEYYAGTGGTKPDMHWADYPNGWPTYTTPAPPTDLDSDGIADSWETARGLNTSTNDSAQDDDGNGYTNIEEYLHYLAGDSGSLPLTGDLNSDGKVDITDIQACVNHVLGAQDWGTKADVNGDGAVNVLDVQAIVNTILSQ